MCGIVGYIGTRTASEVILDGLEKLEYRGYDSAGIAVFGENGLMVEKKKGRLANLKDALADSPIEGTLGIGHTRWATHGEPSDENSHPHCSENKNVAVVHNGIIENYLELKSELIEKGIVFKSDTDTEVVAHLVDMYYEGDLVEAVYKTLEKVRGAYALGIIHKDMPDILVSARKDSPLVVGVGENENFIASDVPALLKYTKQVYFLEDGEVAVLKSQEIKIYDEYRQEVDRDQVEIEWDLESATKAGYPHFMLKEIFEQPKSIRDTLERRLDEKGFVRFDDINLDKEELEKIDKVYVVACGTAYHAGLVGKKAMQKIVGMKVDVEVASEFRYDDPIIDSNTLVILVSQSGETLDTLAALREAKKHGAKILAITNVIGSSISREAENVIYTWAGPEIAVASTKAYTTQVVCFFMLALDFALKLGKIDEAKYKETLETLKSIPEKIETVLTKDDELKDIAENIKDAQSGFFLGRGMDYNIAMEGSLKMKEVSYMHTEAFASGELKHGTIALIEDGIPVVALATQEKLFEKSISNMKEVKSRGAYVIGIAQEGHTLIEEVADKVIYLPRTDDLASSILSAVVLQLLAYHVSTIRGLDVDKPRNLAKSVTVE